MLITTYINTTQHNMLGDPTTLKKTTRYTLGPENVRIHLFLSPAPPLKTGSTTHRIPVYIKRQFLYTHYRVPGRHTYIIP